MDELSFIRKYDSALDRQPMSFKPMCTCLVGTAFTVADPWCPEHKVVMDFSGFVSTED